MKAAKSSNMKCSIPLVWCVVQKFISFDSSFNSTGAADGDKIEGRPPVFKRKKERKAREVGIKWNTKIKSNVSTHGKNIFHIFVFYRIFSCFFSPMKWNDEMKLFIKLNKSRKRSEKIYFKCIVTFQMLSILGIVMYTRQFPLIA